MDNVDKESASEVQAKYVNIIALLALSILLVLPQQREAPMCHVLLVKGFDDNFAESLINLLGVLGTHLLEDGDEESLADEAIFWLLQELDDLLKSLELDLVSLSLGGVLDSLGCAHQD